VTVRPARPEEAAEISALAMRAKAHWGYDRAFLDACRDELTWTADRIRREDVLVCSDGSTVLGMTARAGDAPDGVLLAVFVDPAHHGRGVGRALAEAVLLRASVAGYRTLTIGADPNAEGFYRAVGADRIGSVESDTRAGRMLPLLRFDLARLTPAATAAG
jgi:GNAT superfamily N-acetyltransferase